MTFSKLTKLSILSSFLKEQGGSSTSQIRVMDSTHSKGGRRKRFATPIPRVRCSFRPLQISQKTLVPDLLYSEKRNDDEFNFKVIMMPNCRTLDTLAVCTPMWTAVRLAFCPWSHSCRLGCSLRSRLRMTFQSCSP